MRRRFACDFMNYFCYFLASGHDNVYIMHTTISIFWLPAILHYHLYVIVLHAHTIMRSLYD